MNYKGYNINLEEATKFTVRKTQAASVLEGGNKSSEYTVSSSNMLYRASCDLGSTFAADSESAINLIKKLIDRSFN